MPDEPECLKECPEPYYAPLSAGDCVAECGDYQIANDFRECVCKAGLEASSSGKECIPPSGKSWRDFAEYCAAEGRLASLTEDQCVEQCGEN